MGEFTLLWQTSLYVPWSCKNGISEPSTCWSCRETKHVPLPATSHNVIKWKGEMGTMTLNNYLGKIFFLYLSQCELCLHCFVSLWAIDTGRLSFVQVMLIFTGHSPGVCLPRQLGQWVRKSNSQQSLTQWPVAQIYCTMWSLTEIVSFLKNFLRLLRTSEGGGGTQLDRRSSLKITVDGNQSCVPAQKTKYLKPAKATGFNPTCALSLLDPLNVKHCDNRSWQK